MFSRFSWKQSVAPAAETADEDHFAEIIETVAPAGNVVRLPETRFGRALTGLIRDRNVANVNHLDLIANLAREVSETGVNAIWMAHNLREMAGASRTISGAVEELAASTSVIAESSTESAVLAKRATDAIVDCAANADNATKAMTVIGEKTNDIDARLDVLESASAQIGSMATNIEAIAGRTNMLALNATIEAARAGEAGRGFAVVAGEVKALSHQTSGVTEEIRRRLSALAAEMAAIRVAVSESRSAVTEGQNIVHSVAEQVSSASIALNEVADRARVLADHLAQQRAATHEIADGTEAIAQRIGKTESEIEAIHKRLAGCEKVIEDSWPSSAIAVLARSAADAAVFKRKLAAILTAAQPPVAIAAWLNPGQLRSNLRSFLESDAALNDIVTSLERSAARSQDFGAEVVRAVASKDWRLATSSFEKCEEELAHVESLASTCIKHCKIHAT